MKRTKLNFDGIYPLYGSHNERQFKELTISIVRSRNKFWEAWRCKDIYTVD